MRIDSPDIRLSILTVSISILAENMENFIKDFSFTSLNDVDEVILIIQGSIKHRSDVLFDNQHIEKILFT